jgi:FMN-dependent NADH-azoreductase
MSARTTAMNILQINGSARATGSNSTRLADAITGRLRSQLPDAQLTLRDLATNPHPVLDAAALAALSTPAVERTPEQAARVALDDALIAEVQAADVVVLGVPMYNFGIPSTLKAWIDRIAIAGKTFRYTAEGPQGLVGDKRLVLALARGGVYEPNALGEHQESYLRFMFGFLGITDPVVLTAEGLARSGADRERIITEALAKGVVLEREAA